MNASKGSCPRCGYDLSGAIESWKDSCPLEGLCSECGLRFRWHDVILAERIILRGFFEHARGSRQRLAWAWRTWCWVLWPPVFWRRIGMRIPVRPRAAVLWLVVLLGPLYALAPLTRNIAEAMNQGSPLRDLVDRWPKYLAPWAGGLWQINNPSTAATALRSSAWSLERVSPILGPALTLSIAFPMVLLALPDTRALAKVRAAHILRAVWYGLAWLVLPLGMALMGPLADFVWGLFLRLRVRVVWPWPLAEADYWLGARWPVGLAMVGSWIVFWWWTCVRTLLVGHRPGRVFAVVMVPVLLALSISLLLSYDFLRALLPH